jgi:hypothetical protein
MYAVHLLQLYYHCAPTAAAAPRGNMAGIGSDASYDPNRGGYGGGGEVLGDIGQKGISFLTTSLSTLSTGVQVQAILSQ